MQESQQDMLTPTPQETSEKHPSETCVKEDYELFAMLIYSAKASISLDSYVRSCLGQRRQPGSICSRLGGRLEQLQEKNKRLYSIMLGIVRDMGFLTTSDVGPLTDFLNALDVSRMQTIQGSASALNALRQTQPEQRLVVPVEVNSKQVLEKLQSEKESSRR